MVCYENIESGTVSDGIVTDPCELTNSGALIGWDAEAAAVQAIPCSETAGVLNRGGAAVTTWFPMAGTSFTWEGMLLFDQAHTGAGSHDIWVKHGRVAAGALWNRINLSVTDVAGATQLQFKTDTAGGGGALAARHTVDVPSLGVFHHYAWVVSGTTSKIYVDGRLLEETTITVPATGDGQAGVDLYLLAINRGFYNYAEWRFWNVARTEDEIRNLWHVSFKSSGDANLIFNLSPKSTALVFDEVNRHDAAKGTSNTLATGIIDWLDAPDYSLVTRSLDKYAPLPLPTDLATHVRFYRSTPYATGASPTAPEIAPVAISPRAFSRRVRLRLISAKKRAKVRPIVVGSA
jgi:hypothetical protein